MKKFDLVSFGDTVVDFTPAGKTNKGTNLYERNPGGSTSMVIVAVICHLLLSRTPFGRHVYAIGGNPRVAQLSGIKVDRDVRLHYIIGGLCSALAGIMMCSRMGSAQPTMGTQWSMDNITAIVIGGNSFRGGSGSIINSVLGVLLLTMITNGLNIIGVNVFWQLVVTSVILIITIVMNARRT